MVSRRVVEKGVASSLITFCRTVSAPTITLLVVSANSWIHEAWSWRVSRNPGNEPTVSMRSRPWAKVMREFHHGRISFTEVSFAPETLCSFTSSPGPASKCVFVCVVNASISTTSPCQSFCENLRLP